MLSCELQKRQWAIPAEPEIFSQIVICLFLHADICDITFFCYVRPVTKENSTAIKCKLVIERLNSDKLQLLGASILDLFQRVFT